MIQYMSFYGITDIIFKWILLFIYVYNAKCELYDGNRSIASEIFAKCCSIIQGLNVSVKNDYHLLNALATLHKTYHLDLLIHVELVECCAQFILTDERYGTFKPSDINVNTTFSELVIANSATTNWANDYSETNAYCEFDICVCLIYMYLILIVAFFHIINSNKYECFKYVLLHNVFWLLFIVL